MQFVVLSNWLAQRKEPSSLWKAAILLLDTIFVTSSNLSEFQRQVVNPNALKFGTALAALAEKGELPAEIEKLVDAFPRHVHPMTQLSMGVAALNTTSKFAAEYEKGMKKTEYWKPTLEDSISLVAQLPALASRIYRNVYHPGKSVPGINKKLDLVGTYWPLNLCWIFH